LVRVTKIATTPMGTLTKKIQRQPIVGIAILGAVFQSQIVSHTSKVLAQTSVGQAVIHRGGSGLTAAEAACEGSALLHAYHVGFSTTLHHLTIIGAINAFGGFVLVRQRDFVVPAGQGGGGHA
jgi:hypothetical protein